MIDYKEQSSFVIRQANMGNAFPDYPLCYFTKEYIYKDLSSIRMIRKDLKDLSKDKKIAIENDEWFLLTVTEVISNLLLHPKRKPTKIYINVFTDRLYEKAMIDVADNSSPFIDFEEKQKKSIAIIEESVLDSHGRGLALVSKMYPDHLYVPCMKSLDSLNHFLFWTPARKKKTRLSYGETGKINQAHENFCTEIKTIRDTQHKKKVFIVDDDKVTLFYLERLLRDEYNIFSFNEALKALEAFSEIKPDMIVSDIHMPDMDGIALRQALSEVKNGDTTPFVFLSASKQKNVKKYVNNLGIDDYLTKPVKKERLLSVIERLLSRSEQLQNKIKGIVGQDITSILQPQLPSQFIGWRTAVRTLQADIGGGDFLLHSVNNQGTSVVISDVMGHGMEAKFFAYAFAGYFRSLFRFLKEKDQPSVILKKFSDAVKDDPLLIDTIVTCLAVFLKEGGEITFASAAHPAPYIVGPKNHSQAINVAGPLPGLIGESDYNPFSYQLSMDERVFLFTDGLIEQKGNLRSTKENQQALLQKVRETLTCDIEEAAYQIWDYYMYHIKPYQEMSDDATFVLLERS